MEPYLVLAELEPVYGVSTGPYPALVEPYPVLAELEPVYGV